MTGKADDLLKRFGRRVRILRAERGMSQEGFAVLCGLDRSYVGGIERGERNLTLQKIGVIAEALGISVAELMRGV
jgi:transcriptional regulator with XRE-family HTH domain